MQPIKKHASIYKSWDADSPVNLSKSLLKAQRAWLKFRDAHCETVAAQYAGGTIQPMAATTCLEQATKERTKQLLMFLEEG